MTVPFYSALVSYKKNMTDGNIPSSVASYKNNFKKYTKNIAAQKPRILQNFSKYCDNIKKSRPHSLKIMTKSKQY